MEFALVQFCPCGHVANVSVTPSIQRQMKDPKRLDAPIRSSSECEECAEEAAIAKRRDADL